MTEGRHPGIRVYYHFHDHTQAYRDNLTFFLATAWRPDLEFVVIATAPLPYEIPPVDNISVVLCPNFNQDFGGVSAVLREEDHSSEVFRIIVNCSVRGPFLDAKKDKRWELELVDLLNEETVLAGASINLLRVDGGETYAPHVQTYCYALSPAGFALLKRAGFFDMEKTLSRGDIISRYECGMSRLVMSAGFRIDCLLHGCRGADSGSATLETGGHAEGRDPVSRWGYFGRMVRPHEVMFFKTERRLSAPSELARITRDSLDQISAPETASWPPARELHRRCSRLAGNRLRSYWVDSFDRFMHMFQFGRYRKRARSR